MTELYKEMLEEDLGVRIEFHNWQVPGEHSTSLLEKLRTLKALRQDIGEAEVITLLIPLDVLSEPMKRYDFGEPGECGGEDNQNCLRETFATYMTDTDVIMAEIVALRCPNEALNRVIDTWQIKVRETKETGSFEIFNEYWRAINAHVIDGAEGYNLPVARVYDAFMGEDGMLDPIDRGLMEKDGLHPSPEGSQLMPELLRELGYDIAISAP